jgi:hypothetical protein
MLDETWNFPFYVVDRSFGREPEDAELVTGPATCAEAQ